MQDVLRAVAGAMGRLEYDPQRGSFRGWLFTVVCNKLRNFRAAQARRCQGTGGTNAQHLLKQQPDSESDQEAHWLQEHEQRLFAWAAERVQHEVQESTWQAFWQTAVEGKSGKDAAANLGITVAAVYLAKSRVMSRLREQIQQVQGGEG